MVKFVTERENEILQGVIKILKKDLAPRRIILFGSRAKGKFQKGSDFDFAVDLKKPDFNIERKIKEKIEAISGLYGVDVVYLKSVDEGFRKIVQKTGKVIYER
ncbi:MAG: hypothetical protein A2351_02920 [Omnitrophica bacterium RIFOXYB12_FULL_50_7]|nr:MAG: hypothetical protein A2351_02920 [Omnitrophica bacterium RIFOXYB12_FULL_50_7]